MAKKASKAIPTAAETIEMGNLHPDMPTPRKTGVLTEIAEPTPDPFPAKVDQWLSDAREAQTVIGQGNSISPGEVQGLMMRAIGIIETLNGGVNPRLGLDVAEAWSRLVDTPKK
jgi:hypothetical protein